MSYIFNSKGRFAVNQIAVGEADVRNELRVGLYDAAGGCVAAIIARVDPQGEPQFVMTTNGDGFLERDTPQVIVAPSRPLAEAVSLWDPATGTAIERESDLQARLMAADMAAALTGALEQIEQMKGMFDDADGAIARSIEGIGDVLSNYEATSARRRGGAVLFLATHHHRHGDDQFLFDFPPSDEDVIDAINQMSSYEPDQGESIVVIPITPCRRANLTEKSAPSAPRG